MAENIIEIANEDELPPAPETNKVTVADDKEVVPLKKKRINTTDYYFFRWRIFSVKRYTCKE